MQLRQPDKPTLNHILDPADKNGVAHSSRPEARMYFSSRLLARTVCKQSGGQAARKDWLQLKTAALLLPDSTIKPGVTKGTLR
jgi:hypothetical protein